MRNRRRPDPFADLSESAIAQCRDAARADYSVAARAVAAAADRVQRAESVDDRLAAAFELYRCSVTAAAVTVRYLRLGAHGAAVAGEVVPARVVRRAARLADRAAARRIVRCGS
jgi:hypothetical protein